MRLDQMPGVNLNYYYRRASWPKNEEVKVRLSYDNNNVCWVHFHEGYNPVKYKDLPRDAILTHESERNNNEQ